MPLAEGAKTQRQRPGDCHRTTAVSWTLDNGISSATINRKPTAICRRSFITAIKHHGPGGILGTDAHRNGDTRPWTIDPAKNGGQTREGRTIKAGQSGRMDIEVRYMPWSAA